MYEEYFGLERPPFKITPDTSLFFEGGKRGDILAALVYAVHRGEGIIKVVGEVGSGKTMLCRMLQLKLPATVEIVYIANPSVSAEDILFVIAHELSLPVDRGASKHQVIRLLQDYLLQRHMENKQVVLFIEEAQGMPLDTLEEIRLLSNLETDEDKLLQIILFGQPELDQNLAVQSIRQLRERITHSFELEALTQEEIHNYLNFRMREVGYTGPELIDGTVAKKIELHSAGLLRRINIIADKILLSAFAEGTHNLGPKHVAAAVNDSSFSKEVPRKSSTGLWWLVLLVLIAVAFAVYQTRSQWMASGFIDARLNPQPVAVPQTTVKAESSANNDNPITDTDVQTVETGSPQEPPVTGNDALGVTAQVEGGATSLQNGSNELQDTAVAPGSDVSSVDEMRQIEALSEQVDELVAEIDDAVLHAQTTVATDSETVQSVEDSVAQKPPGPTSQSAQSGGDSVDADGLPDYMKWLNDKVEQSERWLASAGRGKMSVQIMVINRSGARDLVYYLRNESPLDLSQVFVYEVKVEGRSVYRVFYGEYDALSQAREQIKLLPDSVKANSPYVDSIRRMRKVLL
jgi:MSHA biogenesis protein MshM